MLGNVGRVVLWEDYALGGWNRLQRVLAEG